MNAAKTIFGNPGDRLETVGARLLSELAGRANDEAGDGIAAKGVDPDSLTAGRVADAG